MANRYWVGDGGSWNDTTHWSLTSGGASGEAEPTSSDDVFFDGNSFTVGSQTATCNGNKVCNNLNWTGTTNSPIFNITAGGMDIYGSCTFISSITLQGGGTTGAAGIEFLSTSVGNTFTTAGHQFSDMSFGATIGATTGAWTLQDALNVNFNSTTSTTRLRRGTLDTNGKAVNTAAFTTANSTMTLTMGASIFTITRHKG